MKVIGLISGGKDSIYNLLECSRLGHEIVCLANLHPAAETSPTEGITYELDSYMFYTVGHTAIESLGIAMGIPLIRRATKGKAVSTGVQYNGAAGTTGPSESDASMCEDEVEDMMLLLQDCVHAFPEAGAVSSGAILSSYYRTRVENVCGRLGLVSLGYMWRRRQPPLLRDMVASGLDAVLIKVASFGLKPSHVGQTIAQAAPELLDGETSFGLNPCGEGGEYETFCRHCPGLFKRGRVEFVRHSRIDRSKDEYAPDSHLAILEARAVGPGGEVLEAEAGPGAGSEEAGSLGGDRSASSALGKGAEGGGGPVAGVGLGGATVRVAVAERGGSAAAGAGGGGGQDTLSALGPFHVVATLEASPAEAGGASGGGRGDREGSGGSGVGHQVRALLEAAADAIVQHLGLAPSMYTDAEAAAGEDAGVKRQELRKLGLADVVYSRLLVRDMAAFSDVNAAYCDYFGSFPPSRSCIQCDLPGGAGGVAVSLHVDPGSGAQVERGDRDTREVLHVRSWSRWAPSCIGPYAQANRTRGAVLLAGYIGLVPETMQMVEGGCRAQLDMLMRSNGRVLHAMGSALDLALGGVLFRAGGEEWREMEGCTDSDLAAAVQGWCTGCRDGSLSVAEASGGEGDSTLGAALAAHRATGERLLSADRAGWAQDGKASGEEEIEDGVDQAAAGAAAAGEADDPAMMKALADFERRDLGPDFESGERSGLAPLAWATRATAAADGPSTSSSGLPSFPLVVAEVQHLPRSALVESELQFASAQSVKDPDWMEEEDAASRERGLGLAYRRVGELGAWCVLGRGVRRGAGIVVAGLRGEGAAADAPAALLAALYECGEGMRGGDAVRLACCSCSVLRSKSVAVARSGETLEWVGAKLGIDAIGVEVPCESAPLVAGAGAFDLVVVLRTEAVSS